MMPVKHVPYFYTVAVQGLAQETVSVAEMECIHGSGYCKCVGGCMNNKAIRDGKYLARHMPVLGNVHPIKIENVDIFFVTSFLCSLELFYY